MHASGRCTATTRRRSWSTTQVAFVGGIDLTSESGDRFDTPLHPSRAEVGWHDAAVRLDGPAVADVADHFRLRWHEVTGETAARNAASPTGRRRRSRGADRPDRSRSGSTTRCRAGDFRILESYVRAFRDARALHLRREPVPLVVRDRGRSGRASWKRPAAATTSACSSCCPPSRTRARDDTRGVLGELLDADGGAGRVLACTPVRPRGRARRPGVRRTRSRSRSSTTTSLTIGSAEPERALALQRHGAERRRPRSARSMPRDALPAVGRASRVAARRVCLTIRSRRSTGSGRRPAPSSFAAGSRRRAAHAPARAGLPNVSRKSRRVLGPLDGSSSTARRARRASRARPQEPRVERVRQRVLLVEHLAARREDRVPRARGRTAPGSPDRTSPCPSATGGSGRDVSSSQPSTVGMNPEKPQTASGRRPAPSPSASDITQPCENPPSTSFSCGSASSHSETHAVRRPERLRVGEADPRHDVPVRAARRQRQRPARRVAVERRSGSSSSSSGKRSFSSAPRPWKSTSAPSASPAARPLADDHPPALAPRVRAAASGSARPATRYCS